MFSSRMVVLQNVLTWAPKGAALIYMHRPVLKRLFANYQAQAGSAFALYCWRTQWRNRRDGVVVRASASQSVDLGFNLLVESYQKTLKNGIHSFPAWRSALRGCCGEQAGKSACCVLGQDTY